MEMLREYLVVLGYILLLALVLGAVLALVAWFISLCLPTGEDGNRPLPPGVLAARAAARQDALNKIAARAARKGF
jgi:hypothetical protein